MRDALKALEGIGQNMLNQENINGPAINFFRIGKAETTAKVERLQKLREKIDLIGGD